MLDRVAVNTGYRVAELAALTVSSFDLTANPPAPTPAEKRQRVRKLAQERTDTRYRRNYLPAKAKERLRTIKAR